jgi:hypothetical protein
MSAIRGWSLAAVLVALVSGATFGGEAVPAPGSSGGQRLFEVVSKIPIELHGYVKLDAAWDDSRVYAGNFAAWVESEAANEDDDQFNMTANETRLWLALGDADGDAAFSVSGKVEIDFYGAGALENKAHPMLRHAYAQLTWKDYDLSLLAGQTWDVVGPLNPGTLNYTVMWYDGNVGYRRPQLRVTKGFALGGIFQKLELQAAATRNIGHTDTVFTPDPADGGEDSGLPGAQARVALSLALLTDKPTVIGVGGIWQREEYDTAADGDNVDYTSEGLVVDLTLPLTDWLSLKGEFFKGRDLDSILGGVGQGINTGEEQEVTSTGGWVAVQIKPPLEVLKSWTFNLGVGVDDPDNEDLVGVTGARIRNFACFANAIWDLGKGVSAGLEFTHLETEYFGEDDADAERVQLSIKYSF